MSFQYFSTNFVPVARFYRCLAQNIKSYDVSDLVGLGMRVKVGIFALFVCIGPVECCRLMQKPLVLTNIFENVDPYLPKYTIEVPMVRPL